MAITTYTTTTQAVTAFGVALRRDGVEVAEVKSIDGPQLAAEAVEATHLKSKNGFREYVGGIKDGGEITLTINFIMSNATHGAGAGILADWNADAVMPTVTWDLVWPNGSVWTFPAIQTGWSSGAEVDGILEAEITLQVAGAPTIV